MRCVGLFWYSGETVEVLGVPEFQLLGRKINYNGSLFVEVLLQINICYGSSERFTLTDAQNAARLVPAEGDSDENRKEE